MIFKLEDMKNMSIDEIVNFYKEGLIDLQNISTLATNATIIDAGGYYDPIHDTTVLLIIVNDTGTGYIEAHVIDNDTGNALINLIACIQQTNPAPNLYFIPGLLEGSPITINGKPTNGALDIKVFKCVTGENCANPQTPTCTTTSLTGSVTGKQIYTFDPTKPPAPVLTLTPSSGQINMTWTQPPTTLPIFAYGILWESPNSNTPTIGFLPNTASSYKITGLTNGQVYGVGIVCITQSIIASDFDAQIVPLLSGITISPSTLTINVGVTQQLQVTCIDFNGAIATCPSLTWTSDNTGIATVDSNGNVTGVGLGVVNITASIGILTSNKSTITVNPPKSSAIIISPTSTTIDINDAIQMTAVCTDTNGNIMGCPTLTWGSDNAAVSIDSSGIVVGNNYGIAHITAQGVLTQGSPPITSNASTIAVNPDYTGYLYIASNPPGAEIYIDDVDEKEVTPMLITGLTPMIHKFILTKPKYQDKSSTVLIIGGKITSIYEELIPLSSVCQQFNSAPAKAEIFVDDKDMAFKTPHNICNIPLGVHSFKLVGTFTTKTIGCFNFSSVPTNAKIFIDDVDTGKVTPFRVCNIPAGTHTFSLIGSVNITK